MNKTYEITKADIAGMEPVAEGYKVVFGYPFDGPRDWSVSDNYVGRIFKVDGAIIPQEWGLHFFRDADALFMSCGPNDSDRIYKILAYGQVADKENGAVSAASIIEFVRTYSLKEFALLAGLEANASCVHGQQTGGTTVIVQSYGLRECNYAINCIFCYGQGIIKNHLFNQASTAARVNEVRNRLLNYCRPRNYSPTIPNPENCPNCTLLDWSTMPREMLDYIKSLPEYDAKVFKAITGIE